MSTHAEACESRKSEEADISWISMACFIEGIDPASLGLSQRHLIQVERDILMLRAEPETIAYYRCLDTLSQATLGCEGA